MYIALMGNAIYVIITFKLKKNLAGWQRGSFLFWFRNAFCEKQKNKWRFFKDRTLYRWD